MNENLHPLTLGEVLDLTAHLYRSRFLVYVGIAVIPAGTVLAFAGIVFGFLVRAGVTASSSGPSSTQNALALILVGVAGLIAAPVCIGVTALGWAAMSHAAAASFLGEPITIREAYKSAWTRVWRYLWLCLLALILVGIAPVTLLVAATSLSAGLGVLGRTAGMGAAAEAAEGGIILLAFAGTAVYVVWMLLRICMAFPACVVEQIGAREAIKRASALSRGTKGRILILFLLGVALSWLLAIAASFPVLIVTALLPGANSPQHAQTAGMIMVFAYYVLSFAVQALTKPVYGIALTLFYFDQRIRTEGFDIEWMMRKAGMAQEAPQQPQAQPWPPPVPGGESIAAQPGERRAAMATLDAEPPNAGDLARP